MKIIAATLLFALIVRTSEILKLRASKLTKFGALVLHIFWLAFLIAYLLGEA